MRGMAQVEQLGSELATLKQELAASVQQAKP